MKERVSRREQPAGSSHAGVEQGENGNILST